MQQKNSIDVYSMQNDNARNHINDHLSVISLKRTPKRLDKFFQRNSHTLKEWNVHLLEGIDGKQHSELFKKSRLVSSNVLQRWTPGSYRICSQSHAQLALMHPAGQTNGGGGR